MSTATRPEVAGLTTVRTVGALLPADLLGRIVAGTDLPGLTADDYRLELGVTPREAANRAWSVLTGAWAAYRDALATRPEGDRATGLTRDKWLSVMLRELGFGRVPTTPAGGLQVDGRSFPISHEWRDVPIHLLGWGVDLDRKTPGVPGAADRAPHAMVQELLNRSGEYLWGILANGGTLRLLRDSSSLVGQSYVEFDLEAMFDGEIFSDFAVLFFICHQTRFEPEDPESGPEDCWLERWRTDAVETGARALGALRVGVKQAIEALGTGFLQHPANADLRERVDSDLTLADYHRGLLRLVYRLLFCFVAEDRDLLLDRDAEATARQRYTEWFSTARLRRIALRRRGTRHSDLWQGLSIVIEGLGREGGRPELALTGLGGLFEHGPADVLTGAQLGNDALLAAVRHLSVIQPVGGGPKRTVDYRNLGAEELGGIYESLLEFVPRYDPVNRAFTLESLVGNERKTSGAYYTPTSLIDCLLDSALDPLLDDAEATDDPEKALLGLTACDPACGSGHFLVAAARRIAARLARVRADGSEPTVLDSQTAMHDVVARCIYGVDLNPMAAELAKVSLWLEALQPGRPLSFLDAHIKVGNALLGTTPALLSQGLPDAAFTALEGDDPRVVNALKRQNRVEREGQGDLFASAGIRVDNRTFADAARTVDDVGGLSLIDIHIAQQRQRELEESAELRRARLVADAWCAAFVIEKNTSHPPLTHADLHRWQSDQVDRTEFDSVASEVADLSARYRFFHWHLEFPLIFQVSAGGQEENHLGWQGGFACVLGNPPWERIKLQEQEFFASRSPEIANAPNAAARKKLIRELEELQPTLLAEFTAARRQADGESQFIRGSGRYPLCGRGDVNTYAVFAETDRALLGSGGRLGVILPAGIATDATTQHFFMSIVNAQSLASLRHFENESLVFPNVHHAFRFLLLTLTGSDVRCPEALFSFFSRSVSDLARPEATFTLTPGEIQLLNPNTGTCPIFRSRRDAEITLAVYRRVPVLVRHDAADANEWQVSFLRMVDMSNDSDLFRTATELEVEGWKQAGNRYSLGEDEMLPLYEAKLAHLYDHRWATYESGGAVRDLNAIEHDVADREALPRYWVPASEVDQRLQSRWMRGWLPGFRRISGTEKIRTMIASTLPYAAVGDSVFLALPGVNPQWALVPILSSFAFDFVTRQKMGATNLNYFIVEQLPVLPPSALEGRSAWDSGTVLAWLRPRVLELTYTAWDLAAFAADLGDAGPPFRWVLERRAALKAELDGAFFHLYGIDREDVDYILGTFPVVARNDIAAYGEERTRRLILEAYDHLAAAMQTGRPFESSLDPPPGHGPRHPAR